MGLFRLLIAGCLSAAIWLLLPRAGIRAATQELIALLALLMGGLLPAMTLTATILRGDGFSAKRVKEYGAALSAQMTFWGTLFLFAGLSTAGIVGAKVFGEKDAAFVLEWQEIRVNSEMLYQISIAIGGFGFGVVLARLYPAFVGLKSLLQLNVSMAEAQALANDRSRADALERKAAQVKSPAEYEALKQSSAQSQRDG